MLAEQENREYRLVLGRYWFIDCLEWYSFTITRRFVRTNYMSGSVRRRRTGRILEAQGEGSSLPEGSGTSR